MPRAFSDRLYDIRRRIDRSIIRAEWAVRRMRDDGAIGVPTLESFDWKRAGRFAAASLVLIVACGVLAMRIADAVGSGDPLGHVHRLIDVRTGEVYEWDTRDIGAVALPAPHPETGAVALVPIYELESGRWSVTERDLGLLKHLDDGVEVHAIDPATGVVRSTAGGVKTYTRFSHS